MSRSLKGIIFDLDGVLVNTVDLHFEAWQRLFAEHGIDFSRSEMDCFRGVHQREVLTTYLTDLPEKEIRRCLDRKAVYYREQLAWAGENIRHAPAVELLYAAKAQGLKIGLASSSINAQYVLKMTGLTSLFNAIADGNTVCRSKPAPDIFVWVAGALGVNPAELVVVEDGAAGVEGARTAGMFAVGIGVQNAKPDLNLSMEMLALETIRSGFEKIQCAEPASFGNGVMTAGEA